MSPDSGQSWVAILLELDKVASVARTKNTIAVGTIQGVHAYMGPPSGRKWVKVLNAGGGACPLVAASEERINLYAICSNPGGAEARLYGSKDEGKTWTVLARSEVFEPLATPNCLVDDGSAGLRLVAAKGVFVTKNDGKSWLWVR